MNEGYERTFTVISPVISLDHLRNVSLSAMIWQLQWRVFNAQGINVGRIDELPADEIEHLLRTAIVGRIACCAHGSDGSDGRPYVVPLAYGYDGEAIYAHSGIGRKIRMMRAQPLVTVEVDQAEASDRWRSVIAEGTYEELLDTTARAQALAIIYPDPTNRPDLDPATIIYRIRLTAKSGRYEIPDP